MARDGETVADAAYRVGINIPLDCRDGACGTCRCKVEAGLYDGGSYIEDALSADEAAVQWDSVCSGLMEADSYLRVHASQSGPLFLGFEPSLAEAATAPSLFRMIATVRFFFF